MEVPIILKLKSNRLSLRWTVTKPENTVVAMQSYLDDFVFGKTTDTIKGTIQKFWNTKNLSVNQLSQQCQRSHVRMNVRPILENTWCDHDLNFNEQYSHQN